MPTYGMRFCLVDRAGNSIGQLHHATQASAISASRKCAPCWVIQEQYHNDQWRWFKDIGHRDEAGQFFLSTELEKE